MESLSYKSVQQNANWKHQQTSLHKLKKSDNHQRSYRRKYSSQSKKIQQFFEHESLMDSSSSHRLSIISVDTARLETVAESSTTLRAYSSTMDLNQGRKSLDLDPAVDHRSSYKPSNVRKSSKGQGILFSLNTMLHRKQERMSKNSNHPKH